MATDLRRLTFAVTPEMESALDELKREYYKMNQSELLRMMFDLGYKAWRETKSSPVAATSGERH